jgi:hypothetical protein
MKYGITILVAVAALIWAAPASAQLVSRPHCSSMHCRADSQTQNLNHAKYLCNRGRHATKRWGCQAVQWLTRELKETRATLRKVAMPNHYAGWSCITNGAYLGAPHEGNGYNPLGYSGPLGMTTPWAGYMPPGRDWVHASRAAVYAIAERVSARYGFSDSWMRSQWPQTYPPCAGYFN